MGQARTLAAGHRRRAQQADAAGTRRPHHAGAAEQPWHPRRRQRPAIRHRRKQLPATRRCGDQDSRGDGKGSAVPAGAPQQRPDAAAARRRHRPRTRLRPRHRHFGHVRSVAGDARRRRDRPGVHRRPQLQGEAGFDFEPDQRPDRPREHLPEDHRRPLRAGLDDRLADRDRRAAVAVTRAADAGRRHHRRPVAETSRLARRWPGPRKSPLRCCRPAAASSRSPKRRRSARTTARC